jgi:hypothetical protein
MARLALKRKDEDGAYGAADQSRQAADIRQTI